MKQSNKTQLELVFCITTGRTGTTLLTKLIAALPDTIAEHEPHPSFHSVMRQAQSDPRIFANFWAEKLNHIETHKTSIYVETSNVFSKGFLPCLLRLNRNPKLIFLNREPRKVALSLLSRNSIPGRTRNGLIFSAQPGDPMTLPLTGTRWTDYQMCYWAALDTWYKQAQIETFFKSELRGIFNVFTPDLGKFETYQKLISFIYPETHSVQKIPLSELKASHLRITERKHNPNARTLDENAVANIEYQEAEILDAINYWFPTPSLEEINSIYFNFSRKLSALGSKQT